MSGQEALGVELVPPWTVVPDGLVVAHTQSLANPTSIGRRLSDALTALVPFFDDLQARYGTPTHIGLEKPHAFNLARIPVRQYELQGIILLALWRVSGARAPEVKLVSPSSWKAAALGKGHGSAKPPEYVAWAERVCGWVPGPTRPDDEAAALGIGTFMALEAGGGGVVWGIDPQMPRVSVGVVGPRTVG